MQLVAANGANMPALGFGTWTLKGDQCIDLVSKALETGYRHLDTAVVYENEKEVGEGIRASGVARDDIFLTTKVWFTDIANGDLQRSAENSLKRLGVDQVDLLLIHWPSKTIPLAESIAALNAVHEAGLTRNIGVSNFTIGMLDEANKLTRAPLATNQVEYHPWLDQTRVLEACRKHGMSLTSYCPLNRAGEILAEPPIADAAKQHGKSPAQVILRWHVQQEGVVAIPRTSNAGRAAENHDIFDFELSEEEMSAISMLRSRGERLCDFEFAPVWDAS